MAYKNPEDRREYDRKWSKKNRAKRQKLNNTWRDGQKNRFQEYKATLSCKFCPENATCCLHFHHQDPKQKDLEVSIAARQWSWKRIMKEIDKCIVVCANCHAKIHEGIIKLM